MVTESELGIQKAQTSADTAEAELQKPLKTSEGLKREYDQLLSWADLYEKSSFEAKKMIVSQFVKAVRVGKDYDIEAQKVQENPLLMDFPELGGDEGDRTFDLADANRTLSHRGRF